MRHLIIGAVALSLGGCATLFDGSEQNITLESNAPGALCGISQNGIQIVPPAVVPATHLVPRRPGNLIVTCSAPDHETATVALVNGKHAMTVTGAMVAGVLMNVGTDAISHSWHEAQNKAFVYLTRN